MHVEHALLAVTGLRGTLTPGTPKPSVARIFDWEDSMALSFYDISVPVYRQFLKALLGVLDKGEKHCAEKGIDPASMFATRLYEDMQPFTFQIMMAINHSA